MKLPEIKYHLFKAIDKIEDEKLLFELLNILQNENQQEVDFWDLLTKEQKAEINIAAKESTNTNKITSHKKLQTGLIKSTTKK